MGGGGLAYAVEGGLGMPLSMIFLFFPFGQPPPFRRYSNKRHTYDTLVNSLAEMKLNLLVFSSEVFVWKYLIGY